MEHCWKLSEESKSCAETCSGSPHESNPGPPPYRDGFDPNSCLPYYNNGMDETNIQEWMKSGGAPDGVCENNGVSTAYGYDWTTPGNHKYTPGAYLLSGNCNFREPGNKKENIMDSQGGCDTTVSGAQILCKCKASSTVCTGVPDEIYPSVLDLESFAEEVIEDVFPYNVEATFRELISHKCHIYIKKTDKIYPGEETRYINSASIWFLEINDPDYTKDSYFYPIRSFQIDIIPGNSAHESPTYGMTDYDGVEYSSLILDFWRGSGGGFRDWAIPRIRKNITKYKLYRFHIGINHITFKNTLST